MKFNKEIQVYYAQPFNGENRLMGTLTSTLIRGKEVFGFEYEDHWLQKESIAFGPDLQLFSGRQFLKDDKINFGMFLDSSPDRWGRVLMKRREAIVSRQEGRTSFPLFESDFLLGVYDEHRMGALRFKTSKDTTFQNNDISMAAPPFSSLRTLEEASYQLEKIDDLESNHNNLKWINLLIAPGSSLGGARPKASVIDEKGELWIAKFPSTNDEIDIGAWEMVVHELAKKCGLQVSEAFIDKFYSNRHTLITKRFDRIAKNRIHFASAMTLLGHTDGTNHQDGVSYLDMVELIIKNGSNVKGDLEELWKRIVFNICVSNTDDHLRNHGFLIKNNSWVLSPAYDMNAVSYGTRLSLNISETDNSLDLDLALSVAAFFRIKENRANEILMNIITIVNTWKEIANKYKISRAEQEIMQQAFSKS